MASSVSRIAGTGAGSSGSSSVLTGPPSRAYRYEAKLWAMKRRTPASRAASSSASVPSVRRRLVWWKLRSKCLKSLRPVRAVAWWMMASGFASSTASPTAPRSSRSSAAGSAPSAWRRSARSSDRVVPITSCPRSTSFGTSRVPIAPVAPATNTRMVLSFPSVVRWSVFQDRQVELGQALPVGQDVDLHDLPVRDGEAADRERPSIQRGDQPRRGARWRVQSSAHRFLHEPADPCLFGGGQLLQREGGRPHGAFVEVRLVAEAERGVPRFELVRALEEADDIAVLGIGGHPVPGSRREAGRGGLDDGVEPLGHG